MDGGKRSLLTGRRCLLPVVAALALLSGAPGLAAPDKSEQSNKGGNGNADKKPGKDELPLEITRSDELRFGRLVVTAHSGKVVVPADGLTSYQNAVKVGGTVGPARLTFRGTPNKMIEVMVIAPILSKLLPDGRVELESLDVLPLTNQGVNKYPGAVRMRLDSSGTVTLLIGGTLLVQPNSSAGLTNIPIPVTASYIND